jgi:hypothetical protein
MTYNSFFDALFYSYWVGFGVLGLYLVVVYLVKKRIYGDAWTPWVNAIFQFLVPFLWIMTMGEVNPFAWGYGKPYEITNTKMLGGYLFVRDYVKSSGSKATFGSPSYRMHVIDPKTGEKKVRVLLGGVGTIIGIKGDSLVLSYSNAVVFFSFKTGKELCEWTAKTLPQVFPQLSSGVGELSVDKETKQIALTSLDGNQWTLDILSRSLVRGTPADTPDVSGPDMIRVDKHGLSVLRGGHSYMLATLCAKDGSEHQQLLCGHIGDIINKDEIFLDGQIVAFSQKDTCFIVMHYETIKKLKMIFTCMSKGGKAKSWEVRESQLRPSRNSMSYLSSDEPLPFSCCTDHANDLLIITMDIEIIALRMRDGSIAWREVP